jgi:hypothetical protein
MCNKCFNGLWCLDEKKQYDDFIGGFTKKRSRGPAPVVISTRPAAKPAEPAAQGAQQEQAPEAPTSS